MRIIQAFIFLWFLLAADFILAQQDGKCRIFFQPVYGNEKLELGKKYLSTDKRDSVQIDLLRFYISDVAVLSNRKTNWREENSFHLVDASENRSLQLTFETLPNIEFNEISFNLGIDSITNVSGAMGGDLDPTKGMYWTWQSGYINFKLEGESSLSKAKGNEFQYHLGGYQFPFATCQKIELKTTNKELITINVDVEKMLSAMDISQFTHIMSPGKEAVLISEKIAKQFIVK